MDKKVILISIDGMRPDGVQACGNPFVEELKQLGSWTMDAASVIPSVTLPCHMSIFHSVPPSRHGITTNTYIPPVRPLPGLFEQIHHAGKTAAMFYGWEPLRDVARPMSLLTAEFLWAYALPHTDGLLTDRALRSIRELKQDFVFLYMVETDEKGGHDHGWMTPEYLEYVSCGIDNIKRVLQEVGEDYTVIVTADHGGHDRAHGTELPEDMTIPMFFIGPDFRPGQELHGLSLLNLAPTIADLMGVPRAREWEGTSVLENH